MEQSDEYQIADDIQNAGDGYRDQRHHRVADASKNAAHQIVSHNKNGSGGTDSNIRDCFIQCFHRSLHQLRHGRSRKNHQHRQNNGQNAKQPDAAADDVSCVLTKSLTDLAAHKNSQSHGQSGDDHHDGLHHHRAGGDSRNIRRGSELSHYQQIYRAVHGLQKQRQ